MNQLAETRVRTVVERYVDALDRLDEAVLASVLSPDFDSGVSGAPTGVAAYLATLREYRAGFPDLRVRLTTVVAQPSAAAILTSTSGTHTEVYLGHPPTGRSFTATGADFLTVVDERIVARRGVFDTIGMLIQLGLYGG